MKIRGPSLLLFLFTACAHAETEPLPHSCRDLTSLENAHAREEICQLVNESRPSTRALTLDSQLSQVAQAFARDMYQRAYFSHTSPEGSTLRDRLQEAKVFYRFAGENIAKGQESGASVHQSWMNSVGHRANIVNENYGKLGVGVFKGHWVQVFTD